MNQTHLNASSRKTESIISSQALSLSMVFHFPLYAHGHDRPIIITHSVAFVVFICTGVLISLGAPVLAVPAALVVANACWLIGKYGAYRARVQ